MIKKDFMNKNSHIFLFFFCTLNCFFGISQEKKPPITKDTISIMGVGDIMMGTTYPNSSYLPPKNTDPFKDVHSVLSTADVLFGNFEGTLTDTGTNAKNCKDPSKCYSFKSPEYFGVFLQKAGFDVVSIANNHIGDFGQLGIKNTLKTLDENGIASAGILSKPTAIFKKNGIVYGFVAFAPNKDCLKIHNLAKARQIVADIDAKVDITIVSFHGGAEGTKHRHVTRKNEYFYGENRGNVYAFSHQMIDAGADIIFGHGPHVTRAIELYKGKLIAYSLGNFCTYKRFSLAGVKAYAPILEVQVDSKGNFLKGNIHSALQSKTRYPFLDKEQKAFKEIKKLTLEDFPEMKVVFQDDGSFTYKN